MYNYIYYVFFKNYYYSCIYEYKSKRDLLKNWPIKSEMVRKNILDNDIKIYRKKRKNFGFIKEINVYDFFEVKKCELEKMK